MHEPLIPLCSDEDPLAVARAGGVPTLAELRLHNGTVWRWNRAVYDAAEGGHVRIELRALPAGPTLRDMMANAAFALGRIARGLDDRRRLRSRGNARRQNALRAAVQRRRDLLRRMAGHAHHGGNAVDVRGAHEVLDLVAGDLAVLPIDADEVGPGRSWEELHRNGHAADRIDLLPPQQIDTTTVSGGAQGTSDRT